MKKLKDRVAAITGAASGIGRMLAVNLAKEGCHLAISDIDKKGLEETKKIVKDAGVKVTTHIVDVSTRAMVQEYAAEVVKQHGHVDIIINNAGLAVQDSLADVSYTDFEKIINVNFWGVVYGTKAFLPHLMKRPLGHVVNISSINAMVPFAHNGPYNISKYAVMGLNETLLQELKDTPVKIISVHPGGIDTNIAANAIFRQAANPKLDREGTVAAFGKIAMTSADRASRVIIKGIKKNKYRVMVGLDSRAMSFFKRLTPVTTVKVSGYITRIMK